MAVTISVAARDDTAASGARRGAEFRRTISAGLKCRDAEEVTLRDVMRVAPAAYRERRSYRAYADAPPYVPVSRKRAQHLSNAAVDSRYLIKRQRRQMRSSAR